MISIEPAGLPHAEVLAALHGAAFADAARAWTASDFAELLATPGAQAWIASTAAGGADPVGFLLARLAGGECEIISLGTAPGHRRSGVAGRLLGRAVSLAADAGAPLFLEVGADNLAALALYRSSRFTEVGRRPGYYERGGGRVDALVLRLECGG